ncbi:MAG TPA: STAS domain-containing protein [Synechococcales cyanobacterium M55_K2018_004]|nr:STAS domain-containing protein [Synechococcales cyanobacterium M55_K2018_004]
MQNLISSSKIAVLRPVGSINAANAAEFRSQLLEAIAADSHSAVLVDMAHVDSLDSAGLMALVSALTQAQQLRKRFGLCHVSPSIRIIFEVTQLDRAFELFATESRFETAVAA